MAFNKVHELQTPLNGVGQQFKDMLTTIAETRSYQTV